MVFSEDKDLDISVRESGYEITRSKSFLWSSKVGHTDVKFKEKAGFSQTNNILSRLYFFKH